MKNSGLTSAENVGVKIAQQRIAQQKNLKKGIVDYYKVQRKAPKFERHYASTEITRHYER